MYVILEELQAKDSYKGSKYIKAKLSNNNGPVDVTVTIKAESKKELLKILPSLKKGVVFEIDLKPLQKENASLDDFQIFEEGSYVSNQ